MNYVVVGANGFFGRLFAGLLAKATSYSTGHGPYHVGLLQYRAYYVDAM